MRRRVMTPEQREEIKISLREGLLGLTINEQGIKPILGHKHVTRWQNGKGYYRPCELIDYKEVKKHISWTPSIGTLRNLLHESMSEGIDAGDVEMIRPVRERLYRAVLPTDPTILNYQI